MSDRVTNPWPQLASKPGGDAYARRHAAQRLLQDRLTGAAMSAELETEIAERLDELNALLAGRQVRERDRYDAMRVDLPGRGHPLMPPYVVDEAVLEAVIDRAVVEDAGADAAVRGAIRGRVTFTRFHLGGGAAVHGGVHPLMFDDVLGRVANDGYATTARTVSLQVDYRRVTPLDVELHWDATLDRVEGRKRWASGHITDADGTVLAEGAGLFVELRPGQQ